MSHKEGEHGRRPGAGSTPGQSIPTPSSGQRNSATGSSHAAAASNPIAAASRTRARAENLATSDRHERHDDQRDPCPGD